MERETDQYMNPDEYVQELLINVRSLAAGAILDFL